MFVKISKNDIIFSRGLLSKILVISLNIDVLYFRMLFYMQSDVFVWCLSYRYDHLVKFFSITNKNFSIIFTPSTTEQNYEIFVISQLLIELCHLNLSILMIQFLKPNSRIFLENSIFAWKVEREILLITLSYDTTWCNNIKNC